MGTPIFDPTNSTPLTDRQKICHRRLRRWPLPQYQIWCKSAHRNFWANALNIPKILFIYIYPLFLETRPQVRPVGGFSRLMAHTTRLAQGCAFCSFVDIAVHLGAFPQNSTFGAWIGVFKQNAPIFKFSCYLTTESITTKFCEVIKSTNYPSLVVQICSKLIQDGRPF